mmetsp:Transcript_23325/g.59960  ORF Transcript_23325/g.59960 Transcript_23325/m.59960 type:complete len:314 (-) Transcript_23325:63-1004(-)
MLRTVAGAAGLGRGERAGGRRARRRRWHPAEEGLLDLRVAGLGGALVRVGQPLLGERQGAAVHALADPARRVDEGVVVLAACVVHVRAPRVVRDVLVGVALVGPRLVLERVARVLHVEHAHDHALAVRVLEVRRAADAPHEQVLDRAGAVARQGEAGGARADVEIRAVPAANAGELAHGEVARLRLHGEAERLVRRARALEGDVVEAEGHGADGDEHEHADAEVDVRAQAIRALAAGRAVVGVNHQQAAWLRHRGLHGRVVDRVDAAHVAEVVGAVGAVGAEHALNGGQGGHRRAVLGCEVQVDRHVGDGRRA